MQYVMFEAGERTGYVSIPQAVWIACNFRKCRRKFLLELVSIPQAVWIACNLNNHAINLIGNLFQYRKRYGLHAILSPGSLGNSEPKNRVSNDDPLFAFFPKVSGTFLSRKVLRKGLEASHSKGTFVHERNLILMAFSLDFRASLEQSIPRRMGACQQVSENFSSAVQAKIRRERFRRRFRWISFFWHGTPSFPGGAVRFFGEIADK